MHVSLQLTRALNKHEIECAAKIIKMDTHLKQVLRGYAPEWSNEWHACGCGSSFQKTRANIKDVAWM